MSRVLEIVLSLPLHSWQAGHDTRSSRSGRAARDFGAELVRAWRICPQVRMRRGHERVEIEPCRFVEAEPDGAWRWWTWIETASNGPRIVAARTRPFAPGIAIRESVEARSSDVRVAPHALLSSAGSFTAPAKASSTTTSAKTSRATSRAPRPADASVDVARSSDASAASGGTALSLISERRRGNWHDTNGVVVELVLDDIALSSADGPLRFCELRLAVPDANAAGTHANTDTDTDANMTRAAALQALFRAARELSGAWPAFLLSASTLDRVCAGDAPDARVAPVKTESVDLSGLRALRAGFFALGNSVTVQWFSNAGGARDTDEPEYVHQMRVALRRLRTLARLFPRHVGAAWRDAFSAEFRWLGGLLATVRDWDVCVSTTLPGLSVADGNADAWADTLAAARGHCAAARAELRQALGSPRYAKLELAWLEWLCAFAPAHDAAVRGTASSLRRYAAKRVNRLFGHLYSSPHLTTLDAAARHQVRIDTKRLRYALEFFASLASRRTRGETAKLLARVQSVLGDANDTEVALRCLERLAAPSYQQGFARGYGAAAHRHAAQTAEDLLRKLHPPKFGGKRASL